MWDMQALQTFGIFIITLALAAIIGLLLRIEHYYLRYFKKNYKKR